MEKKKGLKSHVQSKKKKSSGKWKGGKRTHYTYEGSQYSEGRKKGTPNLKKTDAGNLLNKYGVEFTPAEKKALESAVNTNNRKRMKMLEKEGNLPRLVGGQDSGDKVRSLQLMGKESDFILSRKSKSLHQFKTREQYERYMDNLKRVNSPDYIHERVKLYKRNHMKALENVFGDDAKDVIMKIRMMKPKDYMQLIQSDEDLEVSYIYDPATASGKLNSIRTALRMKHKESPV